MFLRLDRPKYQIKNNIRWLSWFSTAIVATALLASIPGKAVGQEQPQPQQEPPTESQQQTEPQQELQQQPQSQPEQQPQKSANLDKAKRLNQQVIELYNQRKYRSAIPLAENVVGILENTLGKKAPKVGNSLNNLARLYHVIGNFQKAEPLYQRALAIYQDTLGKQDPIVGTTLYNLAQLYQSMGNSEKAAPLLKLSQSIFQNVVGQGSPGELLGVGGILKNIPGSEIILPSNSGLQKIE